MRINPLVFILLLSFISSSLSAQDFSSGIAPEFAISKDLSDALEFTGKVETFHSTYSNNSGEAVWQYLHKGTKFQSFISYSIHPLWEITGGYQLEFTENEISSNRLMQQISFVQRAQGFRLGHRLRLGQTFYASSATKYRLRYRFSSDFPMQGAAIDPGEFFFVVSNEVLFESQDRQEDIENRFVAGIGHYFNSKQAMEIGLDYRTDKYIEGNLAHELWLVLGWSVSLNH